jgi:hypothetical protein
MEEVFLCAEVSVMHAATVLGGGALTDVSSGVNRNLAGEGEAAGEITEVPPQEESTRLKVFTF